MTFGDIFSEINLEIPTLNIKWSFCIFATSKEMAKIAKKNNKMIWFLAEEKLCVNQR
jgi:hypothetical protein